MVVVRLATLARGHSGVRESVLEQLCHLLHHRLLPRIPEEEKLYEAGADVPEPLFATDRAILMEYVGGEEAAPQLQHARLIRGAAGRLLERLLWNIELWLDHHIVHADLSPFNVLLWDGRPKVIDFPQAVDARTNGNARHLLERDIANVCRHFERLNPGLDPGDVARKLWSRYRLGYLG